MFWNGSMWVHQSTSQPQILTRRTDFIHSTTLIRLGTRERHPTLCSSAFGIFRWCYKWVVSVKDRLQRQDEEEVQSMQPDWHRERRATLIISAQSEGILIENPIKLLWIQSNALNACQRRCTCDISVQIVVESMLQEFHYIFTQIIIQIARSPSIMPL